MRVLRPKRSWPRAALVVAALGAALLALSPGTARAQGRTACDGGPLGGVVLRSGIPVVGALTVTPGTVLVFAVQGGTCPVTLRLVTNGSGAAFTPATGTYVAGTYAPLAGSKDVVIASDSGGQVASWTVTVVGAVDYHAHDHDETDVAVGCGGSDGHVGWFVVVAALGARGRRRSG